MSFWNRLKSCITGTIGKLVDGANQIWNKVKGKITGSPPEPAIKATKAPVVNWNRLGDLESSVLHSKVKQLKIQLQDLLDENGNWKCRS